MSRQTLLRRAILGFSSLMLAISAQTMAVAPRPPSPICINDNCNSGPPTPGGPVKWNPGHYMASDSVLRAGDSLSRVQSEMDDINNWDQIVGYRVLITWGALEPTQGQYNFALLDQILNRLKTHYNKPKRMVVVILPGPFGGALGRNDASAVPMYIQQDSAYGPSPVAGSYGWWGKNANGASTGAYCAALYRPAVMDRFIALVQAFGQHYDADPYVEGLMFQEDSWYLSTWAHAPDYSEPAIVSQLERMLSASLAVLPHTNIIMENTWLNSIAGTMGLESWMIKNRIAAGTADVVGQSAFADHGYLPKLAWGLQAYAGIANSGVSPADLRPVSHAMVDVEAMDLAGPYFRAYGGPYTPLDILNALNQTYMASHAFWTHLYGSENVAGGTVPDASRWPNLAATVSAHPLLYTAYPYSYPH